MWETERLQEYKYKCVLCVLCVLCCLIAVDSTAQTWSVPTNISNNSRTSLVPTIAIDSSSKLHLVWYDYTPGTNPDIFYSSSTNGTSWSNPPTNISNNSGVSTGPAIAIDSSGNIHVVWDDNNPGNNDIFYSSSIPLTAASASNSQVSATSSVVADGTSESTITITVKDANNNPLSGKTVTISATGSNNTITQPTSATNSSGQTTAIIKSTKAETKTITATVTTDNVAITQTATVTFIPAAVSANRSTISVSSNSSVDNIASITVTLLDANDNSVSGKNVSISVVSGNGNGTSYTLTQPATPTNASGQAFATLSATSPGILTISAVDTTDNLNLTNTVSLTFTVRSYLQQ